jgi:hypothetical protein
VIPPRTSSALPQQGKARALPGSVADHKEIVDFAQRVKKGQMIAGSRYRDHWSQYGRVYRAKVIFATLLFDPPSVFAGQAINCRKIRRRQEVWWRPLRVCSLHRSASTFLDSGSIGRYLAKVRSPQNGSGAWLKRRYSCTERQNAHTASAKVQTWRGY